MLAPFPSVVIYELLIASSLLKILLCVCDLKIFLKSQSMANFVMILISVLKNAYKVFEKVSFESVMCKNDFFVSKYP